MRLAHSCNAAKYIVQMQRWLILGLRQGNLKRNKGSVKMAHIAENISTDRPSGAISAFIAQLRGAMHRRRVYKRTYAELAQLSTSELNDLGISRSMISRLAYEAANKA